jgi:ubiquinone biosynthesis protein
VAPLRFLHGVLRGLCVFAVIALLLAAYGAARLQTLLIRDPAQRRAAVARLQGKNLRRGMSFLGACFVKLGQVMSARPDLFEPELIAELRLLQDKLPPFAFARVRRVLEAELGRPLSEVFAEVSEAPLAAASVAQVHQGRLRAGGEVALKVLRPNIAAQVERDGALLLSFAHLLALHPTIRMSDPVGFTREFVRGLARQTDLRIEAENYATFRRNFADDPRVAFPFVHAELSGERLLVMELVRGHKIDALPPGDHSEVAKALQRATLQMCLVDGFMHADMHPGNMLVRDDGVLVLLDVGLSTRLPPQILELFVDMIKCIAMGTPDDLVEHFKNYHLHGSEVDWTRMRADLTQFVSKFRALDMATLEYSEMTNEIMALGRRYHVRPVAELSLLLVGIVTVQGIGKMLAPDANEFAAMSAFLVPVLLKAGKPLPVSPEAQRAREALQASTG